MISLSFELPLAVLHGCSSLTSLHPQKCLWRLSFLAKIRWALTAIRSALTAELRLGFSLFSASRPFLQTQPGRNKTESGKRVDIHLFPIETWVKLLACV